MAGDSCAHWGNLNSSEALAGDHWDHQTRVYHVPHQKHLSPKQLVQAATRITATPMPSYHSGAGKFPEPVVLLFPSSGQYESVNSIARGQSTLQNKINENSFDRSWDISLWNSHFPHTNTLRSVFLEHRIPSSSIPIYSTALIILYLFHFMPRYTYSARLQEKSNYDYYSYFKLTIVRNYLGIQNCD